MKVEVEMTVSCNYGKASAEFYSPTTPVEFIAANQAFNPTLLQFAEGTTKAGIKRKNGSARLFVSDGGDKFRLGVSQGKLAVFNENGGLIGTVALN